MKIFNVQVFLFNVRSESGKVYQQRDVIPSFDLAKKRPVVLQDVDDPGQTLKIGEAYDFFVVNDVLFCNMDIDSPYKTICALHSIGRVGFSMPMSNDLKLVDMVVAFEA